MAAVDISLIGWIEEIVSYGDVIDVDVTVVGVESPNTLVLVLLKSTAVVTPLNIDDASTVVGLEVEVTCAYTVVFSFAIVDHEGDSVVIPLFAVTVEVDTVFVSV
jgi:hypothetical protein